MAARTDAVPALGQANSLGRKWWRPSTWFLPEGASAIGSGGATFGPGGWLPPSPGHRPAAVTTDLDALMVSTLWRAGNIIADSMARVPLRAMRTGSWTETPLSMAGTAERLGTPAVFDKPEYDFSRTATIQRMVWSLFLSGNVYVLKDNSITNDPETVDQIWVLNPERVAPWRDERGFKWFRLHRPDQSFVDYPADRIVHEVWTAVPGMDVGAGLLDVFGDAGLRMAKALGGYLRDALTDGAIPSLAVTANTEVLTAEQSARIKADWMQQYAGRRVPAVLPRDMSVDVLQSDQTLTTQAAELWNLTALEVSNMTGVPAFLLNCAVPGSTLTYQTTESINRALVDQALMPFVQRLENVFSALVPRTQRAMFDLDWLLRPDVESRYRVYQTGIAAGILTVNEVRAAENMPPLPEPVGQPLDLPAPQLSIVEEAS